MQVIKHLEKIYNIVIKDVDERELYELKYKLEDLEDANDALWRSLAEVVNELKATMKEIDSDKCGSNESLLTNQPKERVFTFHDFHPGCK